MNSAQLRQAFLDFFAGKGHEIVALACKVTGASRKVILTAGCNAARDPYGFVWSWGNAAYRKH